MNTIPSIAIRLAETHLADVAANYNIGDHTAALAATRKLVKDAEGLVMFLEQLAQPGPGLNITPADVQQAIDITHTDY